MKLAKTKERIVYAGKYWIDAGFSGTIETIHKALKTNIQTLQVHLFDTDSVSDDEALPCGIFFGIGPAQ